MVKSGKSPTINNSERQTLLTSAIKSSYKCVNENRLGEWKSGNEKVLEDENVGGGRENEGAGGDKI